VTAEKLAMSTKIIRICYINERLKAANMLTIFLHVSKRDAAITLLNPVVIYAN